MQCREAVIEASSNYGNICSLLLGLDCSCIGAEMLDRIGPSVCLQSATFFSLVAEEETSNSILDLEEDHSSGIPFLLLVITGGK